MKFSVFLALSVFGVLAPALAQPQPSVVGPIELRNPNRRESLGTAPVASSSASASLAPPPVAMFADNKFLFILRGDTLMKFDKKTLKLLLAVELPRPLPSTRFEIGPTF